MHAAVISTQVHAEDCGYTGLRLQVHAAEGVATALRLWLRGVCVAKLGAPGAAECCLRLMGVRASTRAPQVAVRTAGSRGAVHAWCCDVPPIRIDRDAAPGLDRIMHDALLRMGAPAVVGGCVVKTGDSL